MGICTVIAGMIKLSRPCTVLFGIFIWRSNELALKPELEVQPVVPGQQPLEASGFALWALA
jgi:hypothetical protein